MTEESLGVIEDASGNRSLSNARFAKRSFPAFSIGPVFDLSKQFLFQNTEFVQCNVGPGEFAIRAGVVFRNVVFDSIDAVKGMQISTNTVFDRVTFKSRCTTTLWIRPDEVFDPTRDKLLRDWVTERISNIDVMVDISGFWGSVEIVGWPTDKITIDPARHVRVKAGWKESVDWKKLEIEPMSFWRVTARFVQIWGVPEGIYSLPLPDDQGYKRTMAEMAKLRDAGVM